MGSNDIALINVSISDDKKKAYIALMAPKDGPNAVSL